MLSYTNSTLQICQDQLRGDVIHSAHCTTLDPYFRPVTLLSIHSPPSGLVWFPSVLNIDPYDGGVAEVTEDGGGAWWLAVKRLGVIAAKGHLVTTGESNDANKPNNQETWSENDDFNLMLTMLVRAFRHIRYPFWLIAWVQHCLSAWWFLISICKSGITRHYSLIILKSPRCFKALFLGFIHVELLHRMH